MPGLIPALLVFWAPVGRVALAFAGCTDVFAFVSWMALALACCAYNVLTFRHGVPVLSTDGALSSRTFSFHVPWLMAAKTNQRSAVLIWALAAVVRSSPVWAWT